MGKMMSKHRETAVFAALSLLGAAAVPTAAAQWGERPPPPPPPHLASRGAELNVTHLQTEGSRALVGEVWVDNWFALYLNGRRLIEDSVPITTERSFNAERFTFRATPPVTLAFEFRDFMQDETGLEYIGTPRQQVGDGGAIVQFRDAQSGRVVAVSGASWRCLVTQRAPIDAGCARERNPRLDRGACTRETVVAPENWNAPEFDDSGWRPATVYPAAEVRPKGGYRHIDWSRDAAFIWGEDLRRDNVVLCRMTLAK